MCVEKDNWNTIERVKKLAVNGREDSGPGGENGTRANGSGSSGSATLTFAQFCARKEEDKSKYFKKKMAKRSNLIGKQVWPPMLK